MPKLTPAQIDNWRRILPAMTGWPASALSDDDIQKLVDAFNREAAKGDKCSGENSGSKTDVQS